MKLGELIHELPYEDYHNFGLEHKALRSSYLKTLKQSPAHLKYALENPKEETEALRQGKLIHSAFENPEKFMDTYIIEPVFSGYTQKGDLTTSLNCKEVKTKRDQWYSELQKDALVLSSSDASMIIGMINSVKNHRLAKNLLKNGVREVSGFVQDPETGITLQFRPDFIHESGYIIDLKSTRDASESYFKRQIFSDFGFMYILQSAHYTYVAKLLGLQRSDCFTFIAIEKTPPYGLNVFPLGAAHLEIGERWRAKLTKQYAECLQSNNWPSYDFKAINLEIPQYVELPYDEELYGEY